MLRYVVFAVVAGFAELPIDAWLVHYTGSLKYPCDEPMIWASPAYMPFAWAVVLVQICTLGDWLANRFKSVALATLLLALFSGFYIPIYEHLARDANLWYYVCTWKLGNTGAPLYVILAEFLLALPLVWMGLQAERLRGWFWIIALGLIEGLVVMSVSCFIAWPLVGREPGAPPCPPALFSDPCPPIDQVDAFERGEALQPIPSQPRDLDPLVR